MHPVLITGTSHSSSSLRSNERSIPASSVPVTLPPPQPASDLSRTTTMHIPAGIPSVSRAAASVAIEPPPRVQKRVEESQEVNDLMKALKERSFYMENSVLIEVIQLYVDDLISEAEANGTLVKLDTGTQRDLVYTLRAIRRAVWDYKQGSHTLDEVKKTIHTECLSIANLTAKLSSVANELQIDLRGSARASQKVKDLKQAKILTIKKMERALRAVMALAGQKDAPLNFLQKPDFKDHIDDRTFIHSSLARMKSLERSLHASEHCFEVYKGFNDPDQKVQKLLQQQKSRCRLVKEQFEAWSKGPLDKESLLECIDRWVAFGTWSSQLASTLDSKELVDELADVNRLFCLNQSWSGLSEHFIVEGRVMARYLDVSKYLTDDGLDLIEDYLQLLSILLDLHLLMDKIAVETIMNDQVEFSSNLQALHHFIRDSQAVSDALSSNIDLKSAKELLSVMRKSKEPSAYQLGCTGEHIIAVNKALLPYVNRENDYSSPDGYCLMMSKDNQQFYKLERFNSLIKQHLHRIAAAATALNGLMGWIKPNSDLSQPAAVVSSSSSSSSVDVSSSTDAPSDFALPTMTTDSLPESPHSVAITEAHEESAPIDEEKEIEEVRECLEAISGVTLAQIEQASSELADVPSVPVEKIDRFNRVFEYFKNYIYGSRERKMGNVAALLEDRGYVKIRQTGSHQFFRHPLLTDLITLCGHSGSDLVNRRTMKDIGEQLMELEEIRRRPPVTTSSTTKSSTTKSNAKSSTQSRKAKGRRKK